MFKCTFYVIDQNNNRTNFINSDSDKDGMRDCPDKSPTVAASLVHVFYDFASSLAVTTLHFKSTTFYANFVPDRREIFYI